MMEIMKTRIKQLTEKYGIDKIFTDSQNVYNYLEQYAIKHYDPTILDTNETYLVLDSINMMIDKILSRTRICQLTVHNDVLWSHQLESKDNIDREIKSNYEKVIELKKLYNKINKSKYYDDDELGLSWYYKGG